jgi:hypothetical protein
LQKHSSVQGNSFAATFAVNNINGSIISFLILNHGNGYIPNSWVSRLCYTGTDQEQVHLFKSCLYHELCRFFRVILWFLDIYSLSQLQAWSLLMTQKKCKCRLSLHNCIIFLIGLFVQVVNKWMFRRSDHFCCWRR